MRDKIEEYVAEVQRLVDAEKSIFPETVSVEYLKRYARIVTSRGTLSRSVHSFVDLETGDILKAASWKAPAKGVRGNVSDLTKGFSAYGAWYAR